MMIALMSSYAHATTVQYFKLHVPVYTVGAEADPELKIETGLYRSYMDGVYFSGALRPYYAYELDGAQPRNLNPASTMQLKLDIDPHKNKCIAVLDISAMIPPQDKEMQDYLAEGDITLSDILEKVVIATEKNLAAEHFGKSCSIAVKGLEKHPEIKGRLRPTSPLLKTVPNVETY